MTKSSTWEQRGKSLEERFWEKVNKTDGCWLWTSAIGGSADYGVFWVGGKKRTEFAHRVSWGLANEALEIPDGKVVMHSCDNPKCVNPAHLSLGEHKDNKQDSVNKRRHAFGVRNGGGGKLNDEKAAEILSRKGGGLAAVKVGAEYGVSKRTVLSIWNGRIWKHVQSPSP